MPGRTRRRLRAGAAIAWRSRAAPVVPVVPCAPVLVVLCAPMLVVLCALMRVVPWCSSWPLPLVPRPARRRLRAVTRGTPGSGVPQEVVQDPYPEVERGDRDPLVHAVEERLIVEADGQLER